MAVLWRCNSRTAVSVLKVSETNRTIWGKGKGQGQGKGQGRGREDVCADLQDLELKKVERAPSNMVRGNPGGRYQELPGPDVFWLT